MHFASIVFDVLILFCGVDQLVSMLLFVDVACARVVYIVTSCC